MGLILIIAIEGLKVGIVANAAAWTINVVIYNLVQKNELQKHAFRRDEHNEMLDKAMGVAKHATGVLK